MTCDYCDDGVPIVDGWHVLVDPEGIDGTARIPCPRRDRAIDIAAVRVRDANPDSRAPLAEGLKAIADRRTLLAEVDRLTELQAMWETAVRQCHADERARLREALNELEAAEPGEDAISRDKALDLVMP